MPSPVTYQDYLRSIVQPSEGGPAGALPEDQWNAMSLAEQMRNLPGGGLTVGANDPRYGLLAQQTGAETGRPIELMSGVFNPNQRDVKGNLIIKDPSRVLQGDGYYGHSSDNQTSGTQANSADSGLFKGDKWDFVKMAAFMAAAAAGGGALTDTGVGAGAGGGLVGPPAGLMNFGLDALPALETTTIGGLGADSAIGGGLLGSAPDTGGLLGSNAADGGMMSSGGYGNGGMIAPGMGNSAAADSFLINNGMSGLAGGNLTGVLSPTAWSGIGSNAINAAIRNPLQTYGLIRSGVGLLTGGQGNSGSPGGGSGSKNAGGTGVPAKVERPQFQPNPFLLQQLQRGGYQHP